MSTHTRDLASGGSGGAAREGAAAPEDGGGHPLVDAFFADQLAAGTAPERRIHPGDEMLRSLVRDHRGDYEQAVLAYFTSGLTIAAAYRQILRSHFGPVEAVGRVLDFAGGYGRVTRYLARELGADRVWMSEIHPQAVEFQRRTLGVQGFVSSHRAASLEAPGTFDAVLVTSLFTHLPEPSFRAWLRRLVEILAPGGVLVLSAHHPDLLLAGDRPAPGELLFRAVSESDVLDTAEYGSTWIDELFFGRALEEVARDLGRPLAYRYLPKGLCAHHDLYAVHDEGAGDSGVGGSPGAVPFRGQPAIYVENVAVGLDGTLSVEGWAADLGGNAPTCEIELAVSGEVVDVCRDFSPRPDVAGPRELPEERVRAWRVAGPSPLRAPRTETRILLKARTAPGSRSSGEQNVERQSVEQQGVGQRGPGEVEHVVFLGSLQTLLAVTHRRQAEELGARAERLAGERDLLGLEAALRAHEVSAMRESRFWKLRDRWFALKKRLGLIDEVWP